MKGYYMQRDHFVNCIKATQAIIGQGAILLIALSQWKLFQAEGPFCKLYYANMGYYREMGHFMNCIEPKQAIIVQGVILQLNAEGPYCKLH